MTEQAEGSATGPGPDNTGGWTRGQKIAATAAVVPILAALIAWAATASTDSEHSPREPGVIQQCVINGSENDCDINGDADLSDAEIAEQMAASEPPATGPYPTVVLNTEAGRGLIIRNSPYLEGQQVGSANNRATVWVDCRVDSGFNPAPDSDAGSIWYRVHWPSSELGMTFYNSSPGDPAEAYAYSGYLFTFGDESQIRDC
ncbi:hypothetical protein O2W15_19980 [Modestobacter sp. VKM Ac-2979]|uniref:hypothetical protein n=1 Tax=unclassified Modestobacter TaxID=2643866 RepID=UPI0022AB9A94|nr:MULTISPECIES: hypothetical protein [unclassified Modestobacter]MCZ2813715.1 hypothetical protein [Modestobacter sp. VKM Ac-2979]MCZ2844310.1 hypothetical protein [Modestobacter sp. VKM Ac-2980]